MFQSKIPLLLFCFEDGTEVSIDSDLMTIHNDFGETWKVERSDWLFQFADFVNEIAADIEAGASYQASYEATFDDESLEQQANEVNLKRYQTFLLYTKKSLTPL